LYILKSNVYLEGKYRKSILRCKIGSKNGPIAPKKRGEDAACRYFVATKSAVRQEFFLVSARQLFFIAPQKKE
jgi:hypothetical protein